MARARIIGMLLAIVILLSALGQPGGGSSGDRIQAYYLYSHECLSCEQSWPLISESLSGAGARVELTEYDITSRAGAEFARAHGISSVPAIVFDDGSIVLFEQAGDPQAFASEFREKLGERAAHKPPVTLMRNVTRSDSSQGLVTVNTFVACCGDRPVSVDVKGVLPEGSSLVSGSERWNGVLQPGESHCVTCTCQLPKGTREIPPLTVSCNDGSGLRSMVLPETPVVVLQELSALAIYLAGLIAGINPCLLAVLAFIGATAIADTGHRRAVMLRIAGFCCGMLAIYLLIGVGLMELIQRVPAVDTALRAVIILLLIALAVWSFFDAYRTWKGVESTGFRSILDRIKPLYHRFGITASFAIGGLFGLVKMPCVGGIYIAILGTILESGDAARGIPLLIVYNLGVVTPVLLLGTLISVGLSPATVNRFRLRHRVELKAFTGLLLACMAAAFILGIM